MQYELKTRFHEIIPLIHEFSKLENKISVNNIPMKAKSETCEIL